MFWSCLLLAESTQLIARFTTKQSVNVTLGSALLPCHDMLSRITTCFHPYVITKNGSPCSFVVLEDLIFNFQPKPMHHVLQYQFEHLSHIQLTN